MKDVLKGLSIGFAGLLLIAALIFPSPAEAGRQSRAFVLHVLQTSGLVQGATTFSGRLSFGTGITAPLIQGPTDAALTLQGNGQNVQIRDFNGITVATFASGQAQFGGASGALFLNGSGLYFQEFSSDPSAPSANTGVVYMKDNGSGKTQLVVRFPTGAVQVIATEP